MNDNDKTLPNAAGSIILFTLLFGIGYAVVRYHFALEGLPVPHSQQEPVGRGFYPAWARVKGCRQCGQGNYEYPSGPK